MKEKIKEHEKLKQLAILSYDIKNNTIPKEYKIIGTDDYQINGMFACVLKKEKTNQIIIAYRGTEKTSLKDIGTDAMMGIKQMPAQAERALRVFNIVKQKYPDAEIILTGHSLGGSLAQIVGALNEVETVTFNAYGTKNLFKPEMEIYPDKITNYINLDDYNIIVQNTKNQIGTCYSIGTKGFAKGTHELEDMADLRTREKFDQSKYGTPSRHPSQGPKEIHTGNTKCKGAYSVRGYTREDGVKVDRYTRSCYVHGGNAIKSYAGKKYSEMSIDEQNQFLEDCI